MATANRLTVLLALYIAAGWSTEMATAQNGSTADGERQNTAEVVPGAAALDPAMIIAHEASWRLVQARTGNELGRFHRSVELVNHTADEPAILTRWHFTTPQRSGLDIYYADSRTLMPIARYVTAPNGMWVQYQSDDRLIVTLTRRTGGEPVFIDTDIPEPRFNNAMLDFVLASLPLAEGYEVSWPTLGTSGRSLQDALATVRARVEGREEVALPSGRMVDAWRVVVEPSRGNEQMVWIVKDPPYLVRREVLDASHNVTVRWELTAVTAR